MTEHKDLLGYDLEVGDHVVYATGYSSDKHMCVAEIVKFTDYDVKRDFYGAYDPETGARGPLIETRITKRWKVRLQPKVYNDYRDDYEYVSGERQAKAPRQVDIHRVENLVKVTLPDG